MLENKDFITWSAENCVVVCGHDGATGSNKQHDPVEETDPKTKEKKSVCPLYPGLTCDEHKMIRADVGHPKDDFGKIEVPSGFPNSWMVGPDGKVEKLEQKDCMAAGALQDALIAFQKTYEAKPIGFKKWEGYKKLLAEGDKALADGKLKAALAPLAKVDAEAKKLSPGLIELVKAKVGAVNEKAVAQFTETKDGTLDVAAKTKAVRALRADLVGVKFSTGNLPVVADIDAWLKENAAAAAPAK